MGVTSEIYLTKKEITKEEWKEFIKIVSDYNGILTKWKLVITNNKNHIGYFIETNKKLPPTINNLNSFLLKNTKKIKRPKQNYTFLKFSKIDNNIIDLINEGEIKKKGTLIYLEINFRKLYEDKIESKVVYYRKKGNIIKKYHVFFSCPSNILSVDFEGNKRYFFKKVPKYLEIGKVLPFISKDEKNSLFSIDAFPYKQGNFYLNLNNYSFDKHSVVIGSSGSGKSKFLSLFISNIKKDKNLREKYKVVVIDPHASLEKDIGGIGKVIDFKRDIDSIDLFINNKEDKMASAELLLELLKSLMADQYNSKLERVLRHSIHLLLTSNSFNFRNLRKILLDTEFRNERIKEEEKNLPVSVIDFFLSDFNDLKTKSYTEAISPIISFIDEMEMIPVFSSEEKLENLQNTIDNNFLTLFSLDRTKLGDKITKTISGLIMQQLLLLIQKEEKKEHIIFVIDEVAVIENPILSRYLSESRKYNLSLILAGQYFNQISEDLKNSIFANVINYYIFRISKLDANILVDNFDMKIPTEDTKEAKIKILTELNNRECIVRMNSNNTLLPAIKVTTENFVSIPRRMEKVENKIITNMEETKNSKISFKVNSNINLKDILKANSSSRKVVRE